MPRKSEALKELEAKYAKAMELINQMSLNHAGLTAQFAVNRQPMNTGQLVVGVRNVSNYTVGLIDKTSGVPVEYNLTPERQGSADPNVCAVLSYAFWQKVRVSAHVRDGLIVRDDSVVGVSDNVAPADRPQDRP